MDGFDLNPAVAATIGNDLATESIALADRVSVGAIATVEDLAAAVDARAQLGAMRQRVTSYFEPLKRMAHQLHKALCDKENAILKPIDTSDRMIAAAMSAYKAEQDRARRAREVEEQARVQRAQEAAALAEAAALERQGESALAAAVVEDALTAPPPVVVEPDPIRDTGAKFRRVWKYRIVDAARVPRDFLKLDDVKIGAYVRAMKSSGDIPGVDIYAVDEPVR
jgi:hypothetical protein